jgi:hypothetical protein
MEGSKTIPCNGQSNIVQGNEQGYNDEIEEIDDLKYRSTPIAIWTKA